MTVHQAEKQLSDETFLIKFENLSLSPLHFKHIGHLRLTWLYLQRYEVEEAVARVCKGIERYATHLGATTKFHLTLTDALVRIMAARVERLAERDWSLFLEQNDDLVQDALGILRQHFSEELLFSEKARTTLVPPDLEPF